MIFTQKKEKKRKKSPCICSVFTSVKNKWISILEELHWYTRSQFNAPPQSSYPLSLLLPIPVQFWKNFLHPDMETPYQMSCFDSKKLNTWSGSLDPLFYSFKPYDAEKSTSTFEMLYLLLLVEKRKEEISSIILILILISESIKKRSQLKITRWCRHLRSCYRFA